MTNTGWGERKPYWLGLVGWMYCSGLGIGLVSLLGGFWLVGHVDWLVWLGGGVIGCVIS